MIKDMATVALAVVTLAGLNACQRNDGPSGSTNRPAKKAAEMSEHHTQQSQASKDGNLDSLRGKEAEAIAIEEVVRRTGLEARQLEAESELKGNVWKVVVSEVPPTPGAFWYVAVRRDGTIKDFTGGE